MNRNTTLVMFGATGDLAQRKLVPAFFSLCCRRNILEGVGLVGFSRARMTDDEFRDFLWDAIKAYSVLAMRRDEWERFSKGVFYVSGDVGSAEDAVRLKQRLEEIEGETRPANRLFYLAIAPTLFEDAVRNLGAASLTQEDTGWRRIVVEKPFGWDLASAQRLNQTLLSAFSEKQVFRIDHYLGKETVQNILTFRFANTIFEPLWNRTYVDNVQVRASETLGVDGRGGYYDKAGVVRDMVQNHLLNLLTLVAMEPPIAADPETLRDRRADVLRAVRRYAPWEMSENAIRGQYEGYREEKGVAPDSQTPTFASMRFFLDNWRWQGVPFYLQTGKALSRKVTQITLQFRFPPHVISRLGPCEDLTSNIIAMCIQPDEGIRIRFDAKIPGKIVCMQPVDMEFHYDPLFGDYGVPEAYERLLEDVIDGDATLFMPSDYIEEAWAIVDPLLKLWEGPSPVPLHTYKPGSWGPDAAQAMLAKDGRTWLLVCGEHGIEHV